MPFAQTLKQNVHHAFISNAHFYGLDFYHSRSVKLFVMDRVRCRINRAVDVGFDSALGSKIDVNSLPARSSVENRPTSSLVL